MYSKEEVEQALAVYERLGSSAKASEVLGYPDKATLRRWAAGRVPHVASCRTVSPCPHKGGLGRKEGRRAMDLPEELPDDPEELKEIIRRQKAENLSLAMERDLMREVVAVVKKGLAAESAALTNGEKALVVEALRGTYSVTSLASRLGLAPSTYYYQRSVMGRPNRREERLAGCAEAVRGAFESSFGAYGYRRVWASLGGGPGSPSQADVRESMRRQELCATSSRHGRHRWSSYRGEAPNTPPNLLLVDEPSDRHCFRAPEPCLALSSDITEMACADGKVYASCVVDLHDGAVLSLAASASPDAALANGSLEEALSLCPPRGGGIICNTDRGAHYRWPGWLALCEEHGVVRSMSRKGHSPDNAPAEGFFGIMKVEMYRGRGWRSRTRAELIEGLALYREWYNGKRIKESLGWRSPRQYRADMGMPPV
jgi:transposase InsO family protein